MKEALIFGWPLVLIAIALLLYGSGSLLLGIIWRDGGHTRRHMDFMRDARRYGLSYAEAQDELYLNERMMQCRIDASAAVEAPGPWVPNYKAAIAKVVERVGLERPHLVDAFRARLSGLSYGDILLPKQCRMVDAEIEDEIMSDPLNLTLEQYGALKIVGEG